MKKEFLHTYQLVSEYKTEYLEELIAKERMIKFMKENDDCFSRNCIAGHFTASAFLLNKEMTHVCLMHHSKLNTWLQLGGHCDGNPDVLSVSIREAKEESGIKNISPIKSEIFDIDIHLIPEMPYAKSHYHFDIRFLLHAYDDNNLIQNHESNDLRWVEKTNKEVTENISRMLQKWKDL